jgi:hypothetical protein
MIGFEAMARRSALAALMLLVAAGGREARGDFVAYDSSGERIGFYLPFYDPASELATIVEGGQQITLQSGPARLTGVDVYGFSAQGAGMADFILNLYQPDAVPGIATLIFSETIFNQSIPSFDDPIRSGQFVLNFDAPGNGVVVPGSLIWTITYANVAPDPANAGGLVGFGVAFSGPPGVGTQGPLNVNYDGTDFTVFPPFDFSGFGGPSQVGLAATFDATAVPEPPSAVLGLAALAALGIHRALRTLRRPRAA